MIIATGTQGTEFSLCKDDNAATLAALDIPSNRGALPLPRKQLRQLGEVDLQPARLVPREQIGSRAPAGLLLIVEIAELLSVLVADDEAGVIHLVDGPGRREAAAGCHACFVP